MLKLCAEYLGRPFVHIYNRLLALGKFPDRFNYSVVNPLFKTHEKSLLCNYRPISQLDFSKISEIMIFWRLNQHLQNHNILLTEEFGFLKVVSTDNATYKLSETISNSWKKKYIYIYIFIAGVFCDLTKAFNCVNH